MLCPWKARVRYGPPPLPGCPVHTHFLISINTVPKCRATLSKMDGHLKSHWLKHLDRMELFFSNSKPPDGVLSSLVPIASPSIGTWSRSPWTIAWLAVPSLQTMDSYSHPRTWVRGSLLFTWSSPKVPQGRVADQINTIRDVHHSYLQGRLWWEFTSREVGLHWTECS